ncbi:GNAT family N-acetyltransferase [Solirubrobacter soli]|uniref:GNAT family N-acetyltransferase n=1 Tax=Solirubrobacter soli TaxID=363832 RepID=UPI000414DBE2|nr:GNAT family N-acetyltransferase [Solirubrobacter soli]
MIRIAHTADLDAATLTAARALFDEAFDDDFTDDDWEHGLGGIHALAYEGDELVGHAAVVMRRMLSDGRALRTGYVESVCVSPRHRRRGHASAVMTEIERIVRGGYDIGALGATDEAIPLYERHGWRAWQGPLSALTPDGIVPTPDEQGAVYVLADEDVDLTLPLTADWRDGDVW